MHESCVYHPSWSLLSQSFVTVENITPKFNRLRQHHFIGSWVWGSAIWTALFTEGEESAGVVLVTHIALASKRTSHTWLGAGTGWQPGSLSTCSSTGSCSLHIVSQGSMRCFTVAQGQEWKLWGSWDLSLTWKPSRSLTPNSFHLSLASLPSKGPVIVCWGVYTTEIYCFTVLEAGSSIPSCPQRCLCLRPPSFVCRRPPSPCVFTRSFLFVGLYPDLFL